MKAFLLLLFAGVKWGKLLTSGGSMLLSLAVYATIWGWRYAAGFVALLFAHEMGHLVAARQRGLKVGAPAFIPFVGAWIALEGEPVDVETEAYVAIAGPVVGTIAALAVYLWARSEDSGLPLAIAYSGLFLNLFNLLPVSPLDGGRVTAVLSPRVWFLGVPMLLALMLYRPSPMLLIVAVLAAPQLLKA
jgi:Zn-dependent protease